MPIGTQRTFVSVRRSTTQPPTYIVDLPDRQSPALTPPGALDWIVRNIGPAVDREAARIVRHRLRRERLVEFRQQIARLTQRGLDLADARTVAAGLPTRLPMHSGHVVYVARDQHETVLYVGVTSDLFSRMAHHRVGSAWWGAAVHLDLYASHTRSHAERIERRLITSLAPLHNVA